MKIIFIFSVFSCHKSFQLCIIIILGKFTNYFLDYGIFAGIISFSAAHSCQDHSAKPKIDQPTSHFYHAKQPTSYFNCDNQFKAHCNILLKAQSIEYHFIPSVLGSMHVISACNLRRCDMAGSLICVGDLLPVKAGMLIHANKRRDSPGFSCEAGYIRKPITNPLNIRESGCLSCYQNM